MCQGEMTDCEVDAQIASYEQQFGMSSEALLQQVREGTVPDSFEHMSWRILLKHRGPDVDVIIDSARHVHSPLVL